MVMTLSNDAIYNPSFSGYKEYPSDNSEYEFDSFKMTVCNYAMSKCAAAIKDNHKCNIDGECDGFTKEITVPTVAKLCEFASKHCSDSEINDVLDKLYKAGALNDDTEKARKIDDKIYEMNDIKHKIKMVKYASEAEKAKKAKQDYMDAASVEYEPESKVKEKAAVDTEVKKVETEVAVV